MNSTVRKESLTAEEIARREWEIMSDPDKIRVKIRLANLQGVFVPREDGKIEEMATFSVFSFGDNHVIERATRYNIEVDDRRGEVSATDPMEFRRLMLKKSLLDWTLDIPIQRREGWMTPECYEKVSRVAAPILDAFMDEFEKRIVITEEEETIVNRQSAVLFSESSRGVSDACEAVSLFCTLGNYWEKFGLNRDNLAKFPQKEYLLLKMMISKEADAMKSRTRAHAQPTTRIAGRGGKTRPSTGKRIPL